MRTCVISYFALIPLLLPGSSSLAAGTEEISPTLEQRLQTLEDREAIRKLLMDYGRFLDQRDFRAFAALFAAAGGEWIGGMGRVKGRAAIRKLMEDTIGADSAGMNSPNFHVFSNETIDVKGDEASALTKWAFVVRGDDNRPQLVYLGHYDDTLIREQGEWKFKRRVVYGDIPFGDPLARE
jgi:hypothetical protein